jgi:hypothetical protein
MIISAVVIGGIAAFLAYKRGRNPYAWFAIGFFFGVLGIFALFFSPSKKAQTSPVLPASIPILSISGPADKFWYYIDPQNEKQGPMSRDAINLAWQEGKVDLSTFIWHEELTDWKLLKDTLKAES